MTQLHIILDLVLTPELRRTEQRDKQDDEHHPKFSRLGDEIHRSNLIHDYWLSGSNTSLCWFTGMKSGEWRR